MKVGIKGRGAEIEWVDVQDLPVTKELVKFKKETQEELDQIKDNLRVSLEERSKLEERIKLLEKYVVEKEGGNYEEDII